MPKGHEPEDWLRCRSDPSNSIPDFRLNADHIPTLVVKSEGQNCGIKWKAPSIITDWAAELDLLGIANIYYYSFYCCCYPSFPCMCADSPDGGATWATFYTYKTNRRACPVGQKLWFELWSPSICLFTCWSSSWEASMFFSSLWWWVSKLVSVHPGWIQTSSTLPGIVLKDLLPRMSDMFPWS